MDLLFALYDSDVFYVTRFMEYFRKKHELNIHICTFTRNDTLIEFLKSNTLDILLIHEELPTEDIPLERVRYVYKLSETLNNKADSEFYTVFKYQAAPAVMKEVVNDYLVKISSAQTVNGSKQVRVITIYPLGPEAEALAYTWSLSYKLSEQRKVLLVMLDPLPVSILSEPDMEKNNLSEFIYYLKNNSSIQTKLEGLVTEDQHLSTLKGIAHGSDILSINKEDIHKWVEELRNNFDYQAVLFYLGSYTEAGNELMRLSNLTFIPYRQSYYHNQRYQVLCKQMQISGLEFYMDRLIPVQLPQELYIDSLPISIQELSKTQAWHTAEEYINTYL